MQFSQQLVSQYRCETSCWRIAQCNMGCLAIFFCCAKRCTKYNFATDSAATGNTIAQCIIQQLVSQFYGSFNKGACAHFLFFVPRSIARQLLRKLHSVTVPQHQTSATCNAAFSTIARQVAEKIAQCNRALSLHILMQIHNNISLYFLENISNILPCTHSA